MGRGGCDVAGAGSGGIAGEVLDKKSVGVGVMDVQMPEMDGDEATGRSRAEERWRDLPVVAMTAHALKGDRERCLDAGMNDYIAKPIKAAEVRDMIDKWVDHPKVEAQARDLQTPASGSNQDQALLMQPDIDIENGLRQLTGHREHLDVVLAICV